MRYFAQALKPMIGDLLATILFVAIYEISGNILFATAFGVASGIAQIAWRKGRGLPVDAMQWMSLVLVVVLGSATLVTRDPRFVLIKPSIGAFAVGFVMLRRNWLGRYLPAIVRENVPEGVVAGFSLGWSLLMFAQGVANLAVAYWLGPKAWAAYTAIVPTASWLALFGVQFLTFRFFIGRRLRAAGAPAAMVPAE